MRSVFLIIVGLLLVGCSETTEVDESSSVANQSIASEEGLIDDNPNVNVQTEELKPTTNWTYRQAIDEMRGMESKFASIVSNNVVQFGFPYDGGSHLDITLRKRSNESTEIMFTVSDGQYSCDTISDNCFAAVKFDNGDIQSVELSSTTDYSSDVLFITNDYDISDFVESLHNSEKLIVELPFYQEGKKQFNFTVSGLNWVGNK